MTFAHQLHAERKRIGLNQAECAKLLGVSPRTLWTWESGRSEPNDSMQLGCIATLQTEPAKRKDVTKDVVTTK